MNSNNLEKTTIEEEKKISVKEKVVDTGTALDYLSGLRAHEILTTRAYMTSMNFALGAVYGCWRDFCYRKTRTTEKSTKRRKYLTDLFALNTFWAPVYMAGISLASYISEGYVDMEKVKNGALYLTVLSPGTAPLFGWYFDKVRKLFKLKSSAEKASATEEKK
jgi:hypothetical protein